MSRVWNFSAGPAALPLPVLEQVQAELLDWNGAGCGVMEMSHRGKEFTSIIDSAEANFRALMGIPANYKALFLQGGATLQFAQIPLNLLASGESADYIVNGSWSKKAYKEAQRVTGDQSAKLAANTDGTRFPNQGEIKLNADARYLHVCTNETIHGVEVHDDAVLPSVPTLVADMSSHILSRPVDVSRYGLIYAGAQKNIGPSGLTIVIIRNDLLGKAPGTLPTMLDYAVQAENGSMLNTPPTFGIYVAGLVFKWLQGQGGLAAIQKVNHAKSALLYTAIDNSGDFYRNPVEISDRSHMNVPFTLANPELDADFLAEAKTAGLLGLKGHKSVGGMRASIYNAMPLQGVQVLVDFMQSFANRKG
jgi:phosphoserine aminotransferase